MKRVPLLQGEYVVGDVLQIGGSMVIWEYGSTKTVRGHQRKRDEAHAR